ncbi:MAG: class IV adenylate cyclase [Bacteroidetes bacterium]|nr:class IV adenylate cyclase [Bacteroidota bacterium]
MQNLELKAHCPDLEKYKKRAEELLPHHSEILNQKDVYYETKTGRLKLRIINGQTAQLIHYFRPDQTENRISEYYIQELTPADSSEAFLDRIFTRWKVVEKTRFVYLYKNARIHLDSVSGLGNFAEFEIVGNNHDISQEDRNLYLYLKQFFRISPEHEIQGSYSDLM